MLQEIEREDAALQESPAKKAEVEKVAVPETGEKAPEQPKKSNVPSGFY